MYLLIRGQGNAYTETLMKGLCSVQNEEQTQTTKQHTHICQIVLIVDMSKINFFM